MQTLACGIERITGIENDEPKSQLVYSFPASFCGVPTIVGHYLLQSVCICSHVVVVLDIANGAKPVEVSRVKFDDNFYPHWTGGMRKPIALWSPGRWQPPLLAEIRSRKPARFPWTKPSTILMESPASIS